MLILLVKNHDMLLMTGILCVKKTDTTLLCIIETWNPAEWNGALNAQWAVQSYIRIPRHTSHGFRKTQWCVVLTVCAQSSLNHSFFSLTGEDDDPEIGPSRQIQLWSESDRTVVEHHNPQQHTFQITYSYTKS